MEGHDVFDVDAFLWPGDEYEIIDKVERDERKKQSFFSRAIPTSDYVQEPTIIQSNELLF